MISKIVYSLISTPKDYYLEQMLLSIYSVKKHNPLFSIEVITDSKTALYIRNCKNPLVSAINHITEIDIPHFYSDVQKSRFLKTQLTKFVEDDFLYLDVDTIIIKNIDSINNIETPLAAVADGNQYDTLEKKLTFQVGLVNKCGWEKELINKPWFNGGVISVKNNQETQYFFDCWHKNWLYSIKCGVNQDQPALCRANQQANQLMQHISPIWNCQLLSNGFRFIDDAKILHYFANRDQNELIPKPFFLVLRDNLELVEFFYNYFASCQNFSISKKDYIFLKHIDSCRTFVQSHSRLRSLLKKFNIHF